MALKSNKKSSMDNYQVEKSKIIYGTSRLHHKFFKKQRYSILKKALELGFFHFDTSPYYGNGIAERELGILIKKNPNKKILISTKFGINSKLNFGNNILLVIFIKVIEKIFPYFRKPLFDYSIKAAEKSLNRSLTHMNISKIDFFFIHEPKKKIKDVDKLIQWLQKQKNDKKIGTWGFAGSKKYFIKWIDQTNVVPPLLQIKSESGDLVNLTGYENLHQISYGFISHINKPKNNEIKNIFLNAFKNRPNHSIIVSTNKIKNLEFIKSIL